MKMLAILSQMLRKIRVMDSFGRRGDAQGTSRETGSISMNVKTHLALANGIACGTLRERGYTDKTHGRGFQIL